VDKFPASYRDISDIVPISDNQEIFSDMNENNPAYSGNQLIIEILDRINKSDEEALTFNFNELADEQSAMDPAILEVSNLGQVPPLINI
jgi:flagellar hook-associated protein FlgK